LLDVFKSHDRDQLRVISLLSVHFLLVQSVLNNDGDRGEEPTLKAFLNKRKIFSFVLKPSGQSQDRVVPWQVFSD
jgi:hypothetical protein